MRRILMVDKTKAQRNLFPTNGRQAAGTLPERRFRSLNDAQLPTMPPMPAPGILADKGLRQHVRRLQELARLTKEIAFAEDCAEALDAKASTTYKKSLDRQDEVLESCRQGSPAAIVLEAQLVDGMERAVQRRRHYSGF